MKSNEYIVFNKTIANELISAGFPVLRIDDSNKEYRKNIFIFQDSAEFRKALKEITAPFKKKEN